jgi:hypothetical protein
MENKKTAHREDPTGGTDLVSPVWAATESFRDECALEREDRMRRQ